MKCEICGKEASFVADNGNRYTIRGLKFITGTRRTLSGDYVLEYDNICNKCSNKIIDVISNKIEDIENGNI